MRELGAATRGARRRGKNRREGRARDQISRNGTTAGRLASAGWQVNRNVPGPTAGGYRETLPPRATPVGRPRAMSRVRAGTWPAGGRPRPVESPTEFGIRPVPPSTSREEAPEPRTLRGHRMRIAGMRQERSAPSERSALQDLCYIPASRCIRLSGSSLPSPKRIQTPPSHSARFLGIQHLEPPLPLLPTV